MSILKIGIFAICGALLVGCGGGSDGGGGGSSSNDYSKMTCAQFTTQAAAQAAYNSGAKQLDADKDGKACENLK